MITLITGPMFSGKSSELCRQIERKHIAGKRTLLIRPFKDTREFVARSWSNEKLKEITFMVRCNDIRNLSPDILDEFDAIFVDEFWMIANNRDLCEKLPKNINHRCDIIFAGIISDINQHLWGEAVQILPFCDEIIKLTAVCSECGSEHANISFIKKKIEGMEKDISKGIGDSEYLALCRKCFLKKH